MHPSAAAAQTGLVKGVEGNDEKGKRLCKVQIVDETGNVINSRSMQTNQVVKASRVSGSTEKLVEEPVTRTRRVAGRDYARQDRVADGSHPPPGSDR